MALFDKFKKSKEKKRIKGAGLLFCPEQVPQKALDQISEMFHIDKVGEENNIILTQEDKEILLLACCPGDEGENGSYAKEQLEGVAGYVYNNPTTRVEIKRSLFYHLRQCSTLIQIFYTFESAGTKETQEKEKQVLAPILSITEKLEGVLTLGDGMTLLNGQGQIILDKTGKSELSSYLPSELPVPKDWAKEAPSESVARRNQSIKRLRERQVHAAYWLPLLWEKAEEPGRTTEEVCARAAALLIVALYSECRVGDHKSYEEAWEFISPIIENYGASKFFSPSEQKYLNDPDSTEQTQIQYSWQYENLWVMEWALGLTDDLFWPDRICDVPASVHIIGEYQTMQELLAAAKLRPREELLQQADLIFRLHWACVDAQVMKMPPPQGVDAGVVMERHRSLFWLAGCDNMCPWDDVDLST